MDNPPPGLRIALIAAPDWVPEPWQSRLIGRLMRDPRLSLSCRISGEALIAAPRAPVMVRSVLALEKKLLGKRQDLEKDHQALTAIANLPSRSAANLPGPRFDLALALAGRHLPAGDLSGLRVSELSLSFAGQPPGVSPSAACLMSKPQDGLVAIDVLARSAAATATHTVRSARYNLKPLAQMTGDFLAEKAILLLETEIDALAAQRSSALPAAPIAPKPRSALAYCAQTLRTIAGRGVRQLSERTGAASSWQLGLALGGVDALTPSSIARLPQLHHTMADPFLFSWRDQLYLFYEATGSGAQRGWIEVALVQDAGLVRLGPALRSQTHLSYPFVFAHRGEVFLMPETQEAKRLEIWRAVEFPFKWELYATAFEGQSLADSSLFLHAGQWWLFTNLSDHSLYQDHSSELYLFAVDGPALRQIEPHPMNPVVIGSDVARNAGAIISEGGRLFRPSQMNAHGVYGYGLNLMQIDRLDRQSYREHLYRRFTPADLPGSAGLHHLSFGAGHHVIDLLPQ